MSGKCEPGYKVHYSHTAGRFSVHSHFSMVAPCNALRKKSWSLAVTDIYLSFIYHIPCSLCLPVNSCGASKRYHYQPLPRWSWKEGGEKSMHMKHGDLKITQVRKGQHMPTHKHTKGDGMMLLWAREESRCDQHVALCVCVGARTERKERGVRKKQKTLQSTCRWLWTGSMQIHWRTCSLICTSSISSLCKWPYIWA